jgi:hypothetical protein
VKPSHLIATAVVCGFTFWLLVEGIAWLTR